jgi:hypothetical protein
MWGSIVVALIGAIAHKIEQGKEDEERKRQLQTSRFIEDTNRLIRLFAHGSKEG